MERPGLASGVRHFIQQIDANRPGWTPGPSGSICVLSSLNLQLREAHPTNLLTISLTGSTALVCWMLGPATHTVLYVACCAAFSVAFMPI